MTVKWLNAYHEFMDLLSYIPTSALLVLLLLIIFIIVLVFIIVKRKKTPLPETPETVSQPETVFPQPEGQVAGQETQPVNISPQPVKEGEGRFVVFIIIAAVLTVAIPLITIYIVRSQTTPETTTEQPLGETPSCLAITIADTFNTPLTEEDLSQLRPGDEIKILISGKGGNFDRARFRVNGSAWQEVTFKERDNFIANYILAEGYKKFTIEAEVHDREKGWL